MKQLKLALICLLPYSMITAQFSVEFSSGEGYQDGELRQHQDWQVFDASGNDPETFTTNTTDSGSLVINPKKPGFQVATYTGKGSQLTSNTYYFVSVFQLAYPVGSSSIIGGEPAVLPVYELQNTTLTTESVSFGLRQVSTNRTSANQFNIFTLNKLNGSNNANFSSLFSGEAMGLAIDKSGNWTDGVSDVLALLYSLEYEDNNVWIERILFVNIETSARITIFERKISDADNSFAESASRFRMFGLYMDTVEVAVILNEISMKVAKE